MNREITIKRIKRGVSKEELDGVRDLLLSELHGPSKQLHDSVRLAANDEEQAEWENVVNALSDQVDDILRQAWDLVLNQIGETITITPGINGPARRKTQRGFLQRSKAKQYKTNLNNIAGLKKIIRNAAAQGGDVLLQEDDARSLLGLPGRGDPGYAEVSGEDLQTLITERLRQSKKDAKKSKKCLTSRHRRFFVTALRSPKNRSFRL